MGAEFLRRAKPTIEKSVDKNRAALAQSDLFTRAPTSIARTALVRLTNSGEICGGDTVVLESTNDGIVVSKGGRRVGQFPNLTEQLAEAIKESCGTALGEVIRVNKLSNTAEVTVS